jgi:hypothetical protein
MNSKELSVKEIIATANSYKYLTDFIAYDPDVGQSLRNSFGQSQMDVR